MFSAELLQLLLGSLGSGLRHDLVVRQGRDHHLVSGQDRVDVDLSCHS